MLHDLLKRQFKVGDTIITKGYQSTQIATITTVIKANRSTVTVAIHPISYSRDPDTGKWSYYRDLSRHMRRKGDECIIINEQLAYNHDTYPEAYL